SVVPACWRGTAPGLAAGVVVADASSAGAGAGPAVLEAPVGRYNESTKYAVGSAADSPLAAMAPCAAPEATVAATCAPVPTMAETVDVRNAATSSVATAQARKPFAVSRKNTSSDGSARARKRPVR